MAIEAPIRFETFIGSLRELWGRGLEGDAHWNAAARTLESLLANPDIKARSESWPPTLGTNLLFYEDPDYHFVVNAVVRPPNYGGGIHDHAHTWTLYGILRGVERIRRYERIDDASRPGYAEVKQAREFAASDGTVDIVRPWLIHSEQSPEGSAAIIVRSEKLGSFMQNRFDPVKKTVSQAPGPTPVPYRLDES